VGRVCSTYGIKLLGRFRCRLEDTIILCDVPLGRNRGKRTDGRKGRRLAAVHVNVAEATNTRRSLPVLRTAAVFRGGHDL
jgi:hypothetical protein